MFASTFALASLASLVAAAPLAWEHQLSVVETAVAFPKGTFEQNATYYQQDGRKGACGLYDDNSAKTIGLPLEFYNQTGVVSPYCGMYVLIKNRDNNVTSYARIADASGEKETVAVNQGTWNAIKADGMKTVSWRFLNQTENVWAKDQVAKEAAAAAEQPAQEQEQQQVEAAPAPQTSAAAQVQQTQAPTTQEYKAPSTTSQYVAPSTTQAYVAPTTQAAKQQVQQQSSGTYSGTATYFYQNGVAGNCGAVHSDSDYIVALTSSMYSGGSHCGQSVRITGNGKTITASVADSCPSCTSTGDLDLSESAFKALSDLSAGVVSISWSWA